MKSKTTIIIAVICCVNFLNYGAFAQEHKEQHDDEEHAIRISPEILTRFGIEKKKAGQASLSNSVKVAGRITPIDEKLSHVSPRFSGVVREVRGKIGQLVKPGEVLAIIQNNQNLQTFPVSAAIPGMVIRRHATLGETVGENAVLFIVADLSSVWAEFAVYKQDISNLKLGQKVFVSLYEDIAPHAGEIIFLSPITEESTQSRVARVLLTNPEFEFSPGAFVTGNIVISQEKLELAVESQAIQQIGGSDTVFVLRDEEIVGRAVALGRSDDQVTEILNGLTSGEIYLSGKTFLLKAELGKSEAEHED